MSTGIAIIQDALQAIGAHSVLVPASPENITNGMRKLNSMLEMWLDQNIQIGFTPLEVPGDDLNEPASTRNGIIWNLAIEMAPDFDNGQDIISANLRGRANDQMDKIAQIYQIHVIPKKIVSDALPVGAGNRRWRGSRVFFRKGSELDEAGINE